MHYLPVKLQFDTVPKPMLIAPPFRAAVLPVKLQFDTVPLLPKKQTAPPKRAELSVKNSKKKIVHPIVQFIHDLEEVMVFLHHLDKT